MKRTPEPEHMDRPAEVAAYAKADFSEVNQRFADRVVELAGAAGRGMLQAVDLGTGPADIPIRVLLNRPKWRIAAVEASRPMVAVADRAIQRAGLGAAICLVLADAKATGLPGAAFDVIFSNSLIHHVHEVQGLWREVKRLAKPGALVFLRDLARPADEAEALAIVQQNAGREPVLLQKEFLRSLRAAYTVDEVRAQLKTAGLSKLQVAMSSDRHLDVWGRPA